MASSPFSRAVVSAMRQLYPPFLADTSFDNTGLLLEAPIPTTSPRPRNSVLLTIDLTRAVADEAIAARHSVIVAYHPIIFRSLKSLTLQNSQQQSLLRLASAGISVYSPHTAVDAVPGGMCDWLCDIVTGKLDDPEPEAFTVETEEAASIDASDTDVTTSESESDDVGPSSSKPNGDPSTKYNTTHALSDPFTTPKPIYKRPSTTHRTYSRPSLPHPIPQPKFHPSSLPHARSVITPCPSPALSAANTSTTTTTYNESNTGYGRLITFSSPQPLTILITRIAHAIGLPKGFPLAIPQNRSIEDISIRTVGVCPGSGGHVISAAQTSESLNVQGGGVDLVFTGEMSHHDVLAITESGGCVVCLFHSNSERGYLEGVMKDKLLQAVEGEWEKVKNDEEGMGKGKGKGREANGAKEASTNGGSEEVMKSIEPEEFTDNDLDDGGDVMVEVSQVDRDPMGIVVLVESAVEGTEL
jgi:dinuclear metal center YbgI/SA1388 family protein